MTPADAAAVISEMTGTNPGRLLNDPVLAMQKSREARNAAFPVHALHPFSDADSRAAWFRFHMVEHAEITLAKFHDTSPQPELPLSVNTEVDTGVNTGNNDHEDDGC